MLAIAFPQLAGAERPAKRVLIIHSFGRDFAPYDAVTAAFRRELASRAKDPVIFLEAALDAGRAIDAAEEAAFVAYLKARFARPQDPDLIVTIGPPAGQFVLRHRDDLFPTAPVIWTALDARLAPASKLKPGDAVITSNLDVPRVFETMVQVLPNTTTVAVIAGDSTLEKFWQQELRSQSAFLADRVRFVWLYGLSLEQIKERVAALPADAAVFYAIFIVDAAGIPHERLDALAEIKAVSHSPIFSTFENELGTGVVGGPYLAQSRGGREAAQAALRSLSAAGAAAPEPTVKTIGMERPIYDGRELVRWKIDESRLPPESEIRFRPLSMWQQHRAEIVVALTVIGAQALLIAALLWQSGRRRRAEREARSLGGRLISAHEDERRRLARELHDDVTQRLAALAIQATKLEGGRPGAESRESVQSMRDQLVELSEDVHALSYRLHPTVIEDLGLVEALRAECDRVARSEPIRVNFEAGAVPAKLPSDAAVGLFRVAQAALRNVARHAKASEVRVALQSGSGRLVLAVQDNGTGFETGRKVKGASLGIASMRERMRLLDGALEVDTAPGRGTTITAWVPLPEAM
ncbi:MAG TPA: histidine kinase [Burkholderiaceae bacterium]|nr:histidine kinase [Burkholderiaceae bacterium]HQR70795.1 histidine kinase [Burkholderiaceae bacterium]